MHPRGPGVSVSGSVWAKECGGWGAGYGVRTECSRRGRLSTCPDQGRALLNRTLLVNDNALGSLARHLSPARTSCSVARSSRASGKRASSLLRAASPAWTLEVKAVDRAGLTPPHRPGGPQGRACGGWAGLRARAQGHADAAWPREEPPLPEPLGGGNCSGSLTRVNGRNKEN